MNYSLNTSEGISYAGRAILDNIKTYCGLDSDTQVEGDLQTLTHAYMDVINQIIKEEAWKK
jgi:hypothetical protein